jgi:hypothetical protein
METLYLIREKNTQFCTIGITDDVSKKIDEMNIHNPRELVVEKVVQLEKLSLLVLFNVIRGKFEPYKTPYSKWYNLSKSKRDYFLHLLDSFSDGLKNI